MCGAVRFAFTGKPRFVSECVCESCRSAHGATVVPWVGVKDKQFSLTSEDTLKWYASSAESERGFCSACGTRLFFRSKKWPGETHMVLTAIEGPHNLKCSETSFKRELPTWSAVKLQS